MNQEFITILKNEFNEPLPGKKVQFKMASESRLFFRNIEKNKEPKAACVLILLYLHGGSLFTVLIKRTPDNGPHSGQIAFPGGKYETSDSSFFHGALREAKEEIGLAEEYISFIGELSPLHIPVSNIKVYPYVGFINSKPILKANPEEVAEIYETQINKLLSPESRSTFILKHKRKSYKAPCFILDNSRVWGATAMILNEFLTIYKRAKKIEKKQKNNNIN